MTQSARIVPAADPGKAREIGTAPLVIGRAPDCDLVIDDDYLSEHQSRIIWENGQHVIENLGQTPLRINGRLTARHSLRDGDQITLSDQKFTYHSIGTFQPAQALSGPAAASVAVPAPVSMGTTARLVSRADPDQFVEIDADETFIGRDSGCTVQIQDEYISPRECRIVASGTGYLIEDLGQNPLRVNGRRTRKQALQDGDEITILDYTFRFEIPKPARLESMGLSDQSMLSTTEGILRELSGSSGSNTREIRQRSMMIVRAFEHAQKKQKRKYLFSIAIILVLALVAVAVALVKHIQVGRQKDLAGELFYTMKDIELRMARLQQSVDLGKEELRVLRAKRREMEQTYDRFTRELGTYDEDLNEQEQLILRMARVFGECEVNMPKGFIGEVKRYIRRWQSSDRLANAVHRAVAKGYHLAIAEALLGQDLPPQFFYLALVESNLDTNAVGPQTRYGVAKGMWQFIPATARLYGLETGPLQQIARFDPRDERHDFEKATQAAARYLRYIYTTEAQASGLLVMASYNWGEGHVRARIRKLPENPRERNFWRLLAQHRIPDETYNYVYSIFAAAVIGEDPRLFGFDFDNPFLGIEKKLDADS